jgi:hypothetical protein
MVGHNPGRPPEAGPGRPAGPAKHRGGFFTLGCEWIPLSPQNLCSNPAGPQLFRNVYVI